LPPQAQLAVGDVLCHPEWPVPLAVRLTARLLVLDVAVPILRGQQVSASGSRRVFGGIWKLIGVGHTSMSFLSRHLLFDRCSTPKPPSLNPGLAVVEPHIASGTHRQ